MDPSLRVPLAKSTGRRGQVMVDFGQYTTGSDYGQTDPSLRLVLAESTGRRGQVVVDSV